MQCIASRLEYLTDQPDAVTRMLEKAANLLSPSKGYATYRTTKEIRTKKGGDIIPLMNVMAMDAEKMSQVERQNPNTSKLRSDGLEGLGSSVVNNILNPLLALTKQKVKPLNTNVRSKIAEPVLTSDAADDLSKKLYSSKQLDFSKQQSRDDILSSISLIEPNNEILQDTKISVSVEHSDSSKPEPEENKTSVSSSQVAKPESPTSSVRQKTQFFESQSIKSTATREKRAPSVTTSYPSVERLRAQFEQKMTLPAKEPKEESKKKPGLKD